MQNFGRGPLVDQSDRRTVSEHTCADCGQLYPLVEWDPLWVIHGVESPEIALIDGEWICWECALIAEQDIYYHWDQAGDPLFEDHACFGFLYS